MGKGCRQEGPVEERSFSWEEVGSHDKKDDRWIVIEGQVYDITKWAYRHPGGSRVIGHYSGQDATDAFRAFHKDLSPVKKYLKLYKIGHVDVDEYKRTTLDEDFEKLRETAHGMNLFKPSYCFFVLCMAQVLALDALAYFVVWKYGAGWLPFIASILIAATCQAQCGWLQHDFGHRSVFKSSKVDAVIHHFFASFIKGASGRWWNHMHYQHHAKPNVIDKDPDVRVEKFFVLGEKMPLRIAEDKNNTMPYNLQHKYFFAIGPPLLYPVAFQFLSIKHMVSRRNYLDLFLVSAFFAKQYLCFGPYYGLLGTYFYYLIWRIVESHWFTWVSQSNHIPMEIDDDDSKPWVKLQMHATCDIEKSFFNDWFTGHLNFQIEHHLFPTMPRHNLYKIKPLVKSLCEKHGVHYETKTLYQAFRDIPKSLKHSGELWFMAYRHIHCD